MQGGADGRSSGIAPASYSAGVTVPSAAATTTTSSSGDRPGSSAPLGYRHDSPHSTVPAHSSSNLTILQHTPYTASTPSLSTGSQGRYVPQMPSLFHTPAHTLSYPGSLAAPLPAVYGSPYGTLPLGLAPAVGYADLNNNNSNMHARPPYPMTYPPTMMMVPPPLAPPSSAMAPPSLYGASYGLPQPQQPQPQQLEDSANELLSYLYRRFQDFGAARNLATAYASPPAPSHPLSSVPPHSAAPELSPQQQQQR